MSVALCSFAWYEFAASTKGNQFAALLLLLNTRNFVVCNSPL